MTINEFIKDRNVDPQAVRRYIERHPEEFENHLGKKGREIDLDEVAVEILDKKYPMQQIIQVVEDSESLTKLEKTQDLLFLAYQEKEQVYRDFVLLQKELNEKADLIAHAEYHEQSMKIKDEVIATKQQMLDDRELQLQKERERNQKAEQEIEKLKQELAKFKPTMFGRYKKVD